jgi:hypothetical protein
LTHLADLGTQLVALHTVRHPTVSFITEKL